MAVIGRSSWKAAKIILAVASPIQRLVDFSSADTHKYCNQQAIKILENDGMEHYAGVIREDVESLNYGVGWADKGWKYLAHYLNAETWDGLGPWPDAASECSSYFQESVNYWHGGKYKKSIFFLGAALHLVQDLCVPYHAKGVIFNGHHDYEKWVGERKTRYAVDSGGLYAINKKIPRPQDWIYHNALISSRYYNILAQSRNNMNNSVELIYDLVTKIVFPLAQRSTAGFIKYFLDTVKAC